MISRTGFRSNGRVMLSVIALIVAVAIAAIWWYYQYPRQTPDGTVRGYLAMVPASRGSSDAVAGQKTKNKAIYVPGVTVYLRDSSTNAESKPGRTDLSGRFTLYAPKRGKYQLCWKSDVYAAGCSAAAYSAGIKPTFLSTVTVGLPVKNGYVAVYGKVDAADGETVRTFDPLLNINAFARVALQDDKAATLADVFVNNFGEYLLPYVPEKANVKIIASEETAEEVQEVQSEAQLHLHPTHSVNLRFNNHRPRLEPLSVRDKVTGARVHNAAVGSALTLQARGSDPDGDSVEYTWFVGEGDGSVVSSTGPNTEWALPATPGRYSITLVASDKKGGYDKETVSVLATGGGTPFTGHVVDTNGIPVDGADVEIISSGVDTKTVATDVQGYIATEVKPTDRYIVNIRKEGYALNSRVYDSAVTGARWVLRRAQVVTIDPTHDVHITHERNRKECTGPDSRTASLGVAGESLLVPQYQDSKGNVIDPPSTDAGGVTTTTTTDGAKKRPAKVLLPRKMELGECGPGISVDIPANSIVDANGNLVTAPMKVSISTVDVMSPQQMPGDDSVVLSGGRGAAIQSFGAGALDLPAGYKLKAGASAKLTIPVDRARRSLANPPSSVPLLWYDETKGNWVEETTMSLTNVGGTRAYVAKVTHFTSYNADTTFNNAACLRVFSSGLPGAYDLEVMSPYPDGTPHYKNYPIDNVSSTEHVIYNVTPNATMTLAPMTQGPNRHLLGFYVVNSGPPQSPSNSPDVPPGPPYTSCQNFVVLKVGAAPDSPFGGEFLHGLGFINAENLGFDDLTAAAPTGNALRDALVNASNQYYQTIDPTDEANSFSKFKTKWGFDQDPGTPVTDEIIASYANSGDLGFGRDMHCLKKPNNDVACYVTNYGSGYSNIYDAAANAGPGTSDVDDANAAATRSTVGASSEVATVAMEYSDLPGAPGNKVVKFYVYKKALTIGADTYARSISANLDGRGERPVPQLCMICHGGKVPTQTAGGQPTFGSNAEVTLNSRFVPFDHRFFTSPSGTNPTITAQEQKFKDLNVQIVSATSPSSSSDPINEVISGLYNNGAALTQIRDFSVPGWQTGASSAVNGQSNFYQRVIADGCRTCHITQSFDQLQFNTSQKFLHLTAAGGSNYLMLGTAQNRVCGDYTMPHAFRTHEIFWDTYPDKSALQSPPGPGVLLYDEFQNFGNGIPAPSANWNTSLCTTFVANTTPSPSNFFSHTIQPILNGKCTGCHIGGGQAGFLPLTTGASFGNLVPDEVVPGNDDYTVMGNDLLRKISDPTLSQSSRMPKGCFRIPEADNGIPCLPQTDIDKIKAWIRSGAN